MEIITLPFTDPIDWENGSFVMGVHERPVSFADPNYGKQIIRINEEAFKPENMEKIIDSVTARVNGYNLTEDVTSLRDRYVTKLTTLKEAILQPQVLEVFRDSVELHELVHVEQEQNTYFPLTQKILDQPDDWFDKEELSTVRQMKQQSQIVRGLAEAQAFTQGYARLENHSLISGLMFMNLNQVLGLLAVDQDGNQRFRQVYQSLNSGVVNTWIDQDYAEYTVSTIVTLLGRASVVEEIKLGQVTADVLQTAIIRALDQFVSSPEYYTQQALQPQFLSAISENFASQGVILEKMWDEYLNSD